MKSTVYLLICILFICCAPVSESGTEDTKQQKQWLEYAGNGQMPHVVLVSGDEEYRSEEALPQLAKILSTHHGFKTTVLFAQDPDEPGIINPNYSQNIPGLESLQSADMMIIFTRFRALPDDQMKHIDDYLKTGKPVLGIRTSTHGFEFEEADFESSYNHYSNSYEEDDLWQDGFGRVVMGEKWINHWGEHGEQSTKGITAPGMTDHPILNGIEEGEIWGPTDVYGVRMPLPGDSQPIVLGQVTTRDGKYDKKDPRLGMRPTDSKKAPMAERENEEEVEVMVDLNDPMMPVAWTKSYQIPGGKQGKVFSTTMGASTDLLAEGTRRMMVNAVFWCLDMDVPAKANVDIVGTYSPTRFAFYDDKYWIKKKMKVTDQE